MITFTQLVVFLPIAFLVILAPGPDNLSTIAIGASHGRRQAVAFAIGSGVGCLCHTLLAALGVTALVAASPHAFTVLKVLGAGYLVWLGISALRVEDSVLVAVEAPRLSQLRSLVRGLLANLVNPKVGLFFLAFLPQFVRPDVSQGLQFALLGLVFAILSAATFAALGWMAGGALEALGANPCVERWIRRTTAAIFVGLGIKLLLLRR